MEDWRIGVRIGVVLGVKLRGQVIEVRTYLIFELKYLHDMSEVFMLSIGINKEINRRTIKQTKSIRNTRYLWRTRSSLYLEL